MSFIGAFSGRRKALPTVRLVHNGDGTSSLYKDEVLISAVFAYDTAAFSELFSAAQNTQHVNYISCFDDTGFTTIFATGAAASEDPFILNEPGGFAALPLRIDSGIRVSIKPLVTPTENTQTIFSFFY